MIETVRECAATALGNTPAWVPSAYRTSASLSPQWTSFIDPIGTATILECCGIEMPKVVHGAEQTPLPGVSMRYSLDDRKPATRKEIHYHECTWTRGMRHKGWKAAATHGSQAGLGNFDNNKCELCHVDEDPSEGSRETPAGRDRARLTWHGVGWTADTLRGPA
jgi:arylsulfatase A-like enzyme